jgi:hypothetical protein
MRISSRLVYQIVSFSPAAMRVCKFRKHGQKYRIVSWNTVPCDQGGEPAALRKALEENGGQISGCMILTGAMESGTFFSCQGAPLNVRAQRSALEFELPLHMLQVPQDCVIQFARFPAKNQGDPDNLNVYAFDSVAINHMASFLTMARVKADEFIYPLLGIKYDDPPVCLPEIESGFCWHHGEWIPYRGSAEECNKQWVSVLENDFEFPAGNEFSVSDYLACLLVMRLVMNKGFSANEPSVRVMPSKLRPSRLRAQIIIMIFLLLVLGIGWGYRTGSYAYRQYERYSVLVAQRDAVKRKSAKAKSERLAAEKTWKTLEKSATVTAGDTMLLNKLYDLSLALPEDALVTQFRFNDGNCDLNIQTQNRNVDMAQRLHFPYWRINRINQRIVSDTVVTYTISLLKQDQSEVQK